MSRIPKFGFGFKKAKGQSTEEAPAKDDAEQDPPTANMKRSKSLRAPRPVIRSTYFSPTPNDPTELEAPVSHLQLTVVSRSGAASNPNSRAASPYTIQPPEDLRNTVVSPTEGTGRQRATSLSAKQVSHTRSRSVVVKPDKGGHVPVVLGRSKTPTSMTRIASAPPSRLTRTNSVENTLTTGQSATPTKALVRSPVTRTDSAGSPNHHVTSPLGRNDSKVGKVSRVLLMEGTADLNKLASEFSESMSSGHDDVDGGFMSKPGSITSSGGVADSSPVSPSSVTHPSHTSRPGLPVPRSVGPAKSLEPSASKSRLAVPGVKVTSSAAGGGGPSTSRPGSAKAYYNVQITPHPDDQERPRSSTSIADGTAPSETRRASNDSSPSSGRNTPVELRTSAEVDGVTVNASGVEDKTPKGTAEVPPRTPYRVPKVMTAFTVGGNEHMGLNDLEGSVLLEAEDYRRIAQEVKALKTTLLRFKRELQNEASGNPPSTPANSKMTNDISVAERDKSQEEITSLLKEGKAKDAKIETLSVELSQLRAENLKLVDSLKEVEAHRNSLLEKVERLHADKHKLEDRLNCLEKASYYELSESMCVESLQEEDLDGSLLMVDEVDDLEDISNSDINTFREGTGSVQT